jgi:hypothetical protein
MRVLTNQQPLVFSLRQTTPSRSDFIFPINGTIFKFITISHLNSFNLVGLAIANLVGLA